MLEQIKEFENLIKEKETKQKALYRLLKPYIPIFHSDGEANYYLKNNAAWTAVRIRTDFKEAYIYLSAEIVARIIHDALMNKISAAKMDILNLDELIDKLKEN